jgi:hypothetical protein
VYNSEIEEPDCYAVGEREVLAHNAAGCGTEGASTNLPTNAYRKAKLPTRRGAFRFIPPKGSNPNNPVKVGSGFLDRFGNIWQPGPPHHFPGDPIEWDVQLANGGYLNVSIRGIVAK